MYAFFYSKSAQSGMAHVALRDKVGALGAGLSLHYEDLSLAQPQKKERALVLVGKDKGKMGTITVRSYYLHLQLFCCILFYVLMGNDFEHHPSPVCACLLFTC